MSSESFPDSPAQPAGGAGQDQARRDWPLLTDPKAMRALAHPVRMALLELFGVLETVTATQASEVLGESPANCAFHLRTLAKYGFIVEAGGGRGRQRPWRAAAVGFSVSSSAVEGEQAKMAAEALGQVWLDRWFARVKETIAAQRWSAEWEEAVGSQFSTMWLTPGELVALRDEIHTLLSRHIDRRDHPSLRPEGALPVEISAFAFPRQDFATLMSLAEGAADPASPS